jgi:hypothetical protein
MIDVRIDDDDSTLLVAAAATATLMLRDINTTYDITILLFCINTIDIISRIINKSLSTNNKNTVISRMDVS